MIQQAKATIDDLMRERGKAELIGGRIVRYMPTGMKPSRVAARIFRSLDDYADARNKGIAFTDNMGFTVKTLASERQSFCPDASYYSGPLPKDEMRYIAGPPTLAVEVRSKGESGAQAIAELAGKRADYFEAGTQVVWDVDPVAECVHVYKHTSPTIPITYHRGQNAEAEPAVPGWTLAVDVIFSGR